MNKKQRITILISLVTSLVIIGVAGLIAHKRQVRPVIYRQHSVTRAELAAADGKNGRDCLVAVDGTVYQIVDSALWQNGKHIPSKGLAYCGADLSKVIDQAPHGRTKLKILPKIGPLID